MFVQISQVPVAQLFLDKTVSELLSLFKVLLTILITLILDSGNQFLC